MSGLLLSALVGLLGAGLLVGVYRAELRSWRSHLVAFKLIPPSDLSPGDVTTWLSTIAAVTQPPRWSLLPSRPVVLEVVADREGIAHYLIFSAHQRRAILSSLRAALPVRVEEALECLNVRPRLVVAAELQRVGHRPGGVVQARTRTVTMSTVQAASAAYLAAMQPLQGNAQIVLQVMVCGITGRPTANNGNASGDRHHHPHLNLSIRLGAVARSKRRANGLLAGVLAGLKLLDAPASRLARRRLPSGLAGERMHRRRVPLVWPVTASTDVAAGLFGLAPGVHLPGFPAGAARQLPPPQGMARTGCVVATSNYPGTNRPLALRLSDRLAHTYVPGPTGVGKSTLLVNMALQDMAAGLGVVFVDPKGDAIPELLARVPAERRKDVIVVDPSAVSGNVVGWNMLRMPGGELARELAVDHAVHVLHELWQDSWGPRTADVLRASLLTLAHAHAPDGSAFAITDVTELLVNDGLRRWVLAQPSVPPAVRGFWDEYIARSDGDRAAVIGPVMNKLRALSTRTPLRLLLGQSQGIQLEEVFARRRILLVSLGKGTVGPETAQLLGSLLVSGIWQACLGRSAVPTHRRHPVMCYIDELQDVMRLPVALEDMLAQARGLGMGLVLANQSLMQLPEAMQAAVLEVARTTITFQSGHRNARLLAPYFAPLKANELERLAAHEVAIRACVDGRTLTAVTGTTLPLPPAHGDAGALAEVSQERYGASRTDVGAAMAARLAVPQSAERIGRVRRGGGA